MHIRNPSVIQFYAAGIPKGQPRPKAFSRGGRASVYDPGTAEGWKGQVAIAAKDHKPAEPLITPLCLHLEFYMPRPKAHFLRNNLRGTAPIYHIGKPDSDNLAKAVMDALSQLNFWRDDALVCHLIIRKVYDYGRGPGCIITIKEA